MKVISEMILIRTDSEKLRQTTPPIKGSQGGGCGWYTDIPSSSQFLDQHDT